MGSILMGCDMETSHTQESLQIIEKSLREIGVTNYRFCLENDCYICDRYGNFYSVCKRQCSRTGNLIEKYQAKKLKGSTDRYGYKTYRITVDGKKKHLKAHRMMLNTWVGEKPYLVVNHLDGDKKNNDLNNLEWCTIAENNSHAIEIGLFNPIKPNYKNYKIPFSDWMSIYILNKHCGVSFSELGRRNNCSHDTIGKIIKRIDKCMGGLAVGR